MSITDELRKWAEGSTLSSWTAEHLTAIADRIDAEHKSACDEAYDNGVQSVALPDMTAYVKLPLDADGERIHIGDVMEWVSPDEDFKPAIRTVDGVGEQAFFAWTKEDGRYAQYEARAYRRHHAPTVEDVLREFANEVYADADNEIRDRDFLCAKYAKRLTLVGDAS